MNGLVERDKPKGFTFLKFTPQQLFKSTNRDRYLKKSVIVNMLREAYMAGYYSCYDSQQPTPTIGFGEFLDRMRGDCR